METRDEEKVPLLESTEAGLGRRIWVESQKLWKIVGPATLSGMSLYGMNATTQAFAGHLGDLELAAFSIANNVVLGLVFGLLLGMASALETLCGQAYGAKKYHMIGIYLQRGWIVLLGISLLLSPIYFLTTPFLELMGQSREIAEAAGDMTVWMLPLHFSFAMQFPLQRFLQCQLKNSVIAYCAGVGFVFHVFISWLFVSKLALGIIGAAFALNLSWWVLVFGQLGYIFLGGCPLTWTGFSMDAFSGLWDFFKLSLASGVMLCLENWYYRILILLTGNLKNAELALDALSIWLIDRLSFLKFFLTTSNMSINGWEMMIPLSFFAGIGVRVANELGAGNGKGAKFATKVSVVTSLVIGLIFWSLIMAFHDKFAFIFTSSSIILSAVNRLSVLLAFTILLNSIQPILSGVAVGSGWQAFVAYVNIGSYYVIGIPLGIFLGWIFHLGVLGIWAGMIGGTAVQTLILVFVTIRCDWDQEAMKASMRMNKLARLNPSQKEPLLDC